MYQMCYKSILISTIKLYIHKKKKKKAYKPLKTTNTRLVISIYIFYFAIVPRPTPRATVDHKIKTNPLIQYFLFLLTVGVAFLSLNTLCHKRLGQGQLGGTEEGHDEANRSQSGANLGRSLLDVGFDWVWLWVAVRGGGLVWVVYKHCHQRRVCSFYLRFCLGFTVAGLVFVIGLGWFLFGIHSG